MKFPALKSHFSPKAVNTRFDITFGPEELGEILEHFNDGNREIDMKKVEKLRKDMREGRYDANYYAARTVVIDHKTGDVLSFQHRAKAAHLEGIALNVCLNYVDKDFWLSKKDEDRTARDKLVMESRGELTGNVAKILTDARGQIPNIMKGFTSTSGASGKNKISESEANVKYAKRTIDIYDAIPVQYRQNLKLATALTTLYLSDKISISDVESLERKTSRMRYVCDWLLHRGYGTGELKQLAYGIAIIHHAMATTLGDNYGSIPESKKPQYDKSMKYVFDHYN